MDFQALRNSFIIGSLGTSFTGLILLASPYSQFSQFLIASGLGTIPVNEMVKLLSVEGFPSLFPNL